MDGRSHYPLWLSSGCHTDHAVHRLQSRELHALRVELSSRFLARDAVSAVSEWHPPVLEQLWDCFFRVPALRFFIPDTLPIPLPYYWFLLPGVCFAIWQKRFEIPLLAIIPVAGAFVAKCIENRLLMPIPFWVILMSFTFAGILKLRRWPAVQIVLGILAALILLDGLIPSVRYIYCEDKSPLSIHHYAQDEVAVSRFLKHVVAGQEHPGLPHLERHEFNRITGIPDAHYDTLICPR